MGRGKRIWLLSLVAGLAFVPSTPRVARRALPWDAEGNAKAERAWTALAKSYPNAAVTGKFLGAPVSACGSTAMKSQEKP